MHADLLLYCLGYLYRRKIFLLPIRLGALLRTLHHQFESLNQRAMFYHTMKRIGRLHLKSTGLSLANWNEQWMGARGSNNCLDQYRSFHQLKTRNCLLMSWFSLCQPWLCFHLNQQSIEMLWNELVDHHRWCWLSPFHRPQQCVMFVPCTRSSQRDRCHQIEPVQEIYGFDRRSMPIVCYEI